MVTRQGRPCVNGRVGRDLSSQVRALQRQMAILQAGQRQLRTLAQFQAGLGELGRQSTDLGDGIAGTVTAAIRARLAAIGDKLP